jgi:hypothetical protein
MSLQEVESYVIYVNLATALVLLSGLCGTFIRNNFDVFYECGSVYLIGLP